MNDIRFHLQDKRLLNEQFLEAKAEAEAKRLRSISRLRAILAKPGWYFPSEGEARRAKAAARRRLREIQ